MIKKVNSDEFLTKSYVTNWESLAWAYGEPALFRSMKFQKKWVWPITFDNFIFLNAMWSLIF